MSGPRDAGDASSDSTAHVRSPTSDVRTAFEKDYDRLLFSTPVRRLADKTQVFPLERNDSVRTRLTHSHEVSNLAKSMGMRLIRTHSDLFGDTDEIRGAVPVILGTVGLAHDLGNPPFGHQGEVAISRWFSDHEKLFEVLCDDEGEHSENFEPVPVEHRLDFTKFEGNAQSLRLVSRLQNTLGDAGLDLTAATLAALMKYPVASSATDRSHAATKKHGYCASEEDIADWIRAETGLEAGQRHPLTWLMEASDDIAYSVLDIEDTIKKGLVSAEDALAYLRRNFSGNEYIGGLVNQVEEDFKRADKQGKFSLSRVREIKASYLRTRLIARLLSGATKEYVSDVQSIRDHTRKRALLGCSTEESDLCEALKMFARVHAYQSPGVLELELKGSIVIGTLMDAMWRGISERKSYTDLSSRRKTPDAAFMYSLISDSYRWHFERTAQETLPIRYRELQLLADMVSGMTDGFALDLYERVQQNADT